MGRLRPALQLGIAARLAISFIAVAVLVIAANLFVVSQVPGVRTTVVQRTAPVQTVAPTPAPVPPPHLDPRTATGVQPAPPVPTVSTSRLLRSVEGFERAVRERTQANSPEAAARYQSATLELDQATAEFSTAALQAGGSNTVRLSTSVRSYEQHGAELIGLGDSRRAISEEYASRFEELSTRAKHALDQAWKIFGRVVARQSLVKLTGNLDELRRCYAEFIAHEGADTLTLEALASSETAVKTTLVEDRIGFIRVNGDKWYADSVADLAAMSSARDSFRQKEQQLHGSTRAFAEGATSIRQDAARIIAGTQLVRPKAHALETEFAAQRAAAIAAASVSEKTADEQSSGADKPFAPEAALPSDIGGAAAAARGESTAAGTLAPRNLATQNLPSPNGSESEDMPPVLQPGVMTTRNTPQDHTRDQIVAWISFGVLLLVTYISVGTVISIVRPVRRLMRATASLARGESRVRVERGGARELDTLASAFNDMAEQLHAAREAARGQQHLLEAKVAERTQQLQALAQRDPLTRLANRRHFFTLLGAALAGAARAGRHVGVFFLDIDNFKNMNDSLGHAFGDEVLRAIAEKLDQAVQSFGFAARLGGDEFTVVYESATNVEEIRSAGERLVHVFDEPLMLEGREVSVSVSIGASVFPLHEKEAAALLRAADAALFQAKALGRSQLALFTPELLDAARIRFSTEQGLRRAIERGEFELLFQPEVNLSTCRTELVEALLRWRLPDGRLAPPGEFLAVAEESGLIMQINDWVLRSAVQTAAGWYHGAWTEARVAINVSPRQVLNHRFVETVQELLAEFALPPQCVEIELTESVLQTGKSTIEALKRLRALGLAIALDDFGSGFSSLASLEQLPLTRIKLDSSLVASIDASPRSAAIARAIIGLCQSLGLVITAEGIERSAQLACLAGYPGLYGQGFLIARPVSRDELVPVLAKIPHATRALLRASLASMAEPQIAERLPHLAGAFNQ